MKVIKEQASLNYVIIKYKYKILFERSHSSPKSLKFRFFFSLIARGLDQEALRVRQLLNREFSEIARS